MSKRRTNAAALPYDPPVSLIEKGRLAWYLLRETNRLCHGYIPLMALLTLIRALLPFVVVILPGFLIDALGNRAGGGTIGLLIGTTVLLTCVLTILQNFLNRKRQSYSFQINQGIELALGRAYMEMEYRHLEDPKIADLRQIAQSATNHASPLENMADALFSLVSGVLSLSGLCSIIWMLLLSDGKGWATGNGFVDFLTGHSFILLLFIVVCNVLAAFLTQKTDGVYYRFEQQVAPGNRAYSYYGRLARDYACAKDIRLYQIAPMLRSRINAYMREFRKILTRIGHWELLFSGTADLLLMIQTLLIFVLVGSKLLVGAVTIGEFYMYTAAMQSFIAIVHGLFEEVATVQNCLRYQYAYRILLELGRPILSTSRSVSAPLLVSQTPEMTFVFDHVSFHYPGSQEYILRDFSLTLRSGNVVALVGLNGAGKTTLIKLLLRLYEPTDGRILLNGTDIQTFERHSYQQLFSAVFQDFRLFACTASENVTAGSPYDKQRVRDSLQKTGLWEALAQYEDEETVISRVFDDRGIELSGGQAQKLAIARAFYRDARWLIMDEPTAALDPLAELEIYQSMYELVQNKSALFISHRLGSCRFCDRVLVLDQGAICQDGTHDQLLVEEGLYATMWRSQAQYYV